MLKKLLLIDDDKIEHMKLSNTFKKKNINCELIHLYDGEEAIQYLESNKHDLPSLILLDLKMPKVDGFEVLENIKSDQILKRIPVVIFSTSNARKDKLQGFDLQIAGYMVKPTVVKDYEEMINNLMNYWQISKNPDL